MFSPKRFEGEMFIRILQTTLLQIFCKNLLYFQVIFKSMKIADDTFLGNSECEWVKEDYHRELVYVDSLFNPFMVAQKGLKFFVISF